MVSIACPQPTGAESRLAALGIELPPVPTPLGSYVETVQTGRVLYLSGVLPSIGHEPKFIGRLGRGLDLEQGREAARLATLNVLSAVRNHLGSLDRVSRIVKLTTYMMTEPDFTTHPKVADASSELLCDVFGKDKLPVRMVPGSVLGVKYERPFRSVPPECSSRYESGLDRRDPRRKSISYPMTVR